MFYSLNKKCKSSIKSHLHKLEKITLQVLSDLLTVIAILDTSIKKHVTTSIAHVHIYGSPVVKTIHHAVNVTSTKAELFAIKYNIDQVTYIPNIKRIVIIFVVISDSIHIAKKIFDSSSYLF